jgi:hypothetical protein
MPNLCATVASSSDTEGEREKEGKVSESKTIERGHINVWQHA